MRTPANGRQSKVKIKDSGGVAICDNIMPGEGTTNNVIVENITTTPITTTTTTTTNGNITAGNIIANMSSYFAKPLSITETKKMTNHPKKKESTNENVISQQNYGKKTLDEQHTEKINYFRKINEEEIPKLIELKKNRKVMKKSAINVETLDVGNKKIQELKNMEKSYLLKNSKYIFQYFEEKKNISINNNSTNNSFHSFFMLKPSSLPSSTEPQKPIDTPTTSLTPANNVVPMQPPQYISNKKKYENYWKNVNNEILSIQDYIYPIDVCTSCKNGELISQEEEGVLICNNPKCGIMIPYIIESSKPSNKEPPNEVSYTAYIRLNHFKEILSQFQAKETTQIPAEVIDAIRARIKKERIEDVSKIDYHKMREILRKLGLNKYFEHIQYINSLFGIKPPIMNEELHETLCMLFIEIQQPWAIHNPPHRRNFFNYTYTLYQLCVLLDQTQYLPYIPMMKDRDKQLEQDMIWKKVCGELGWKFFPTL
jgi:Poxvirus Late Transcription Factor VLTF3 like